MFHMTLMDLETFVMTFVNFYKCITAIRKCLLQCILRARLPLYRSSSSKTIYSCSCNVLMNIETSMQIGNKLFYLTNAILICGIMLQQYVISCKVLNAMPVNATFWNALANIITNEHRELCIKKVLEPEFVPFFQNIPGSIFEHHIAGPLVEWDV